MEALCAGGLSVLRPRPEAVGEQLLQPHQQEAPLPGRARGARGPWAEAGAGGSVSWAELVVFRKIL